MGPPVKTPDTSIDLWKETVSGKYFWLLLSLLVMVLIGPLFSHLSYGRYFTEIIHTCVLMGAVYVIIRNHRHLMLVIFATLGAGSLKLVLHLQTTESSAAVFLMHLLLTGFVFYVIIVILRDVLSSHRVTTDTIKGAICVYLLIGLIWALLYSYCAHLDPTSFALATTEVSVDQMPFHRERFGITVYYSMVTLTTLGYGDITPTAPITRSLAAIEAVIGQIFLTVLVARLVGMHISTMSSNRSSSNAQD